MTVHLVYFERPLRLNCERIIISWFCSGKFLSVTITAFICFGRTCLVFWGGREIMAKCAFNISLLSFLFVPFHSFPVSFLFSFCIFHLPSAFLLSSAKCISIFHLPPFSIFLSDYHLVDTVEDRVFRSFIFHLHLPSSTLCHRLKNFPNSLVFRSILSVSCQFFP